MVKETGYWQQRVERRRLLQRVATAGAGLAVTTLIGCGEQRRTAPPETPQAQQPKRGGTITRSRGNLTDAYSGGFDPHPLTGAYGPLMGLFYQNLIKYHNVTLDLSLELAQKWEQPSQTKYLFTLAPGVRWQNRPPANGRALVADDVVFSLNRFRSDDPKFINRSLLASADKIEAVDRATVRITTKAPDGTLLMNLADVQMCILNPEVVERAAGRFATVDTAVGTGAFILESNTEEEYKEARGPAFLEWKQPKDEAAREALALLNAAGFSRENPLRFELSQSTGIQGQSATQILQRQYQQLSQGVVQLEIKIHENEKVLSKLSRVGSN